MICAQCIWVNMLQSAAINKKVQRLPAGNKQIEMTKFIVDFVWPHTRESMLGLSLSLSLIPAAAISLCCSAGDWAP